MSYMPGHARREPRRIRPHQFAARRLSPRLVSLLLLFLTAPVYYFGLGVGAQAAPRRAYRPAARPLGEAFESRAANAFAEASRLRSEWTKDSVSAAAEKFVEARSAWLAAGRPAAAIDAVDAAAEAHFTLGAYRQAVRLYTTAAAESRRMGDWRREQAALSRAGRAYSYLGDNDLAQKLLDATLRYYEQQG